MISARAILMMSLALAATIGAGCSAPLRSTGYLADGYDDAWPVREKEVLLRLDAEALEPRVDLTEAPLLFVVDPPEWAAPVPWAEEPERHEEVLFVLRERLYRYLLRNYPHPTRVRYALRSDDPMVATHRIFVVRSAVTHTTKGSGPLRYALGYGMGMASIQVEGEMYEGLARETRLGEFAFRENHAGYAQNGFNTDVLRADYCMKYALDEGIGELVGLLAGVLPPVGVPPAVEPEAAEGGEKELASRP